MLLRRIALVVGAASAVDRMVIRIVGGLVERTLRRGAAAAVQAPSAMRPLGLLPTRRRGGEPAAELLPSTVGAAAWQRAWLGRAPVLPGPSRSGPAAAAGAVATAGVVADAVGTPGRTPRRPVPAGLAWSCAAQATTATTGWTRSSAAAVRPTQPGTIRRLRTPQAGPDPQPTASEPRPLARRILAQRRPGVSASLARGARSGRLAPAPVPDEAVGWATRPVTRVHRTAPEAPVDPRARSTVPDAAGPRTPSPPPFDIDQLDRDLWRRFEKRIRVEQQRRGRG